MCAFHSSEDASRGAEDFCYAKHVDRSATIKMTHIKCSSMQIRSSQSGWLISYELSCEAITI